MRWTSILPGLKIIRSTLAKQHWPERPAPVVPVGAFEHEPPQGVGSARLAVLGDPIEHSKSPELHIAAYRDRGLEWDYNRWRIPAGQLAASLDARGHGWRGFSVTAPLKAEALAWADTASADAQLTGAANTLVFESLDSSSKKHAENTDIAGIIGALAEVEVTALDGPVDVLGAGGTASSAIAGAHRLGADRIRILARRPEAATEVAERFAAVPGLAIEVADLATWQLASGTSLVIDTIPEGFAAVTGVDQALVPGVALFSAAYDPWPTPLADVWTEAGGKVTAGLQMLAHQALVQVRLFSGYSAETALPNEEFTFKAMRAAVGLPTA